MLAQGETLGQQALKKQQSRRDGVYRHYWRLNQCPHALAAIKQHALRHRRSIACETIPSEAHLGATMLWFAGDRPRC
jgi:hypothetical protein